MSDHLTTDPKDPLLRELDSSGQQRAYLVLSDDEIAKGYVRPLRTSYRHVVCGRITSMGDAISMTYARDPHFYGGTFCFQCGTHFSLVNGGERQFKWVDQHGLDDGTYVGE